MILQDAGLDVLLVDAGSYEAIDWSFPSYYMGDGVYLPDAEAVKPVLRIPVAVNGNLTPDLAEQALADGIADFVGFGRMLIADPDLVRKVAEGRAEQVRPCIRCNELCIGNVVAGTQLECSVNPEAAHEAHARAAADAGASARVTVVGGGPGGLEAARVAAERGHEVDLYERGPRLGGVLEPAATPDFKRELHRMVDWWEGELARLGVRRAPRPRGRRRRPRGRRRRRRRGRDGLHARGRRRVPGVDGPTAVRRARLPPGHARRAARRRLRRRSVRCGRRARARAGRARRDDRRAGAADRRRHGGPQPRRAAAPPGRDGRARAHRPPRRRDRRRHGRAARDPTASSSWRPTPRCSPSVSAPTARCPTRSRAARPPTSSATACSRRRSATRSTPGYAAGAAI